MKPTDYKVTLTMDRSLAIVLSRACEVFARVGMGQWKDLLDEIADLSFDEKLAIENHLKDIVKQNNSGIRDGAPESCAVAWDAYQWLRREIAWTDLGLDWRTDKREWNSMMGVTYDEPFEVNKTNGTFNTEVIKL